MSKNMKKYEKFRQKMLKFRMANTKNHSITTRKYTAINHQTLYRTLEEVS